MNEAYAWTRYSSSHICYDGMVSVKLHLRSLTEADWGLVRAIYLDGIASGHATFETGAPDWEEWDSAHLPTPRLVAISGETIVGWAALNAVSKRSVYSGVAEVSVYVDKDSRGGGRSRLAGYARKRIRAKWFLDSAGEHLPRKHRQPAASRRIRVSRGWDAPENRPAQWDLARHALA